MAANIIEQNTNVNLYDFIEFLSKLAPEGETLLVVEQKPVLAKGEPVLHNDGSPKYVWPASLPHRLKPGRANYVNTGSFVLDRFPDGKPSASASYCDYTLFLVLDDVGTKSKIPPLTPTWKIETSPENYQWGYVFSEQPTKGEFQAAMKVIAAAGYTDPGALNAVRNVRIPGSINLKPGRDNFESKLVEFNPELEYTLDDICEALGVNPEAPDTASMKPIHLLDDGDDDIVHWLDHQGLILEQSNGSGWMGIVCPNHAEHTDANIMARYHPVHRSFKCLHAHCVDLDSNTFLQWCADNGAPTHQAGLRPELLTEVMSTALAKITPTDMFTDIAKERLKEIERKELSRIERDEWFERFAYVKDSDGYFDLHTREMINRQTFNALYRHINCQSIHTGRKVEASTYFDENRAGRNAQVVLSYTYAAGESAIVMKDGQLYGNRWIDARPDVSGVVPGDIGLWLDHCKKLVPNAEELNHIFDVMAFKLQNPKIKINHAILHGGYEGSGKDTMWAPFLWSVCGKHAQNRGLMDSDSVHSQWGYSLEAEIILINELKEPTAADRRALANKLKPIIAAPPDVIMINRKGLHPYPMANRAFVMSFTNSQTAISLASQDRRWFCVWSDNERMDEEQALKIWSWYNQGGFEQIAAWLYQRDVSKFNPSATPQMTEFKQNLIEDGMNMTEMYILDEIRKGRGDFAKGVVGSPFHTLCDRLQGSAPTGVKVYIGALYHALEEAGWRDVGRIGSADFSTKKRIFASPEAKATYTKSELRRLVEVPMEPKAVILDMKDKRSA